MSSQASLNTKLQSGPQSMVAFVSLLCLLYPALNLKHTKGYIASAKAFTDRK